METSTQRIRQGWADAVVAASKHSVAMGNIVFGDELTKDMRDRRRALVGDGSICEQCKRLPISEWLTSQAGPDAAPQVWETPLERVIRLNCWCKFCGLLLHMLSQPQNDPLRNSKVAKHVPQEISGVPLSQLVQYDWELIDIVWPFGRTNQPGKYSTYKLGKFEEGIADIFNYPQVIGFTIDATRAGLALAGEKTGRERSSRSHDLNIGMERGRKIEKASQVRYRKQCLLRVSLHKSNRNLSSRCILLVDCRGYTGLQNSQMEVLSKFRLHVADTRGSLPPHYMDRPRIHYSRRVDPRWIDISVTKQWLWECETKHGSECSQHGWEIARESPQFLRVIDVHRKCIIVFDDPAPRRYVALSYMWGGFKGLLLRSSNIATLTQDGGLRRFMKDIPKTVLDAMEVVKAMGERYLWVDALVSPLCSSRPNRNVIDSQTKCKLQETETDTAETKERAKLETIQMDRVYGGALVTLVAASGIHANTGIQGVKRDDESTERSIRQESAEIQGTQLLAALSGGQDLENTPWNRRGWTFQERLLSRRIIAFADNEVVWYCHAMTCREDSANGDAGDGIRPLQALTLKQSWFDGGGAGKNTIWVDGSLEKDRFGMTHLVRSGRFSEYIKAVQQYTHRQLTHRSDILNAFAGLSSIFERSFQAKSLFGLLESVLDIALLWRPEGQLQRRVCMNEDFPSWSWAGWEGAVYYDKPLMIRRNGDGVITGYTRSTQSQGEEGIRPLLRWHIWNAKKHCFEPINGNRGRGFPVPKGGFPKEWESNAFGGNKHPRQLLPEGSVDFESLKPHHLMFSTSCSKSFRLEPLTNKTGKNRSHSSHVILSPNSRPAGAVMLDSISAGNEERGDGGGHGQQREFIVLAEAHHLYANGQVGEFEDYLVMLVARPEGTSIYERLGLGHISKALWSAGKPEIKTVILG